MMGEKSRLVKRPLSTLREAAFPPALLLLNILSSCHPPPSKPHNTVRASHPFLSAPGNREAPTATFPFGQIPRALCYNGGGSDLNGSLTLPPGALRPSLTFELNSNIAWECGLHGKRKKESQRKHVTDFQTDSPLSVDFFF